MIETCKVYVWGFMGMVPSFSRLVSFRPRKFMIIDHNKVEAARRIMEDYGDQVVPGTLRMIKVSPVWKANLSRELWDALSPGGWGWEAVSTPWGTKFPF